MLPTVLNFMTTAWVWVGYMHIPVPWMLSQEAPLGHCESPEHTSAQLVGELEPDASRMHWALAATPDGGATQCLEKIPPVQLGEQKAPLSPCTWTGCSSLAQGGASYGPELGVGVGVGVGGLG